MVTVWQPVAVPGSFGMGTEAAPMPDFAKLDRTAAERGGGLADEGCRHRATRRPPRRAPACQGHRPDLGDDRRDREPRDAVTIVMESRGLVGLRAMLLGSVSGAVVHHAKRPTLIIPPALYGA